MVVVRSLCLLFRTNRTNMRHPSKQNSSISCDRLVHGANAVCPRHTRALLCAVCFAAGAVVCHADFLACSEKEEKPSPVLVPFCYVRAQINILRKFNRGPSAMQHYDATRPMFIDVEVMNTDIQVVLGDEGPQTDSSSIAEGLSELYQEIAAIYKL